MPFGQLKFYAILSGVLAILLFALPAWAAYSVQVGAFREFDHAEELASDLMDAGYTVYFEQSSNGFRRVRVGPFESRAEAEKVGESLKRAMGLDYFLARVTSSEPVVMAPETSVSDPQPDPIAQMPSPPKEEEAVQINTCSFPPPVESNEPQFPIETDELNPNAEELITEARSLMGTPYVWAGDSLNEGGFDCSGFIYYLFTKRGYDMNRRASRQFLQGEQIERANLKPGDLVFFRTYFDGPSHVGIYIGNNEFIHSSSSQNGVVVSEIEGYYDRRYLGARRILGLPSESIIAATDD